MRYLLFDVFAEHAFEGNQLAVFPEAGGLDDSTMQRLANELNLAESIFLTRTGDDETPARVRIFTPGREVPFAGHPTVGATIAIADVLRWVPHEVTSFTLDERVGPVSVRVERNAGTIAWLGTPPVKLLDTLTRSQAAAILSLPENRVHRALPPQVASAGNPFLYIALPDRAAVDDAMLDQRAIPPEVVQKIVGVFLFAQTDRGTYGRMFAPMSGIAEDPATGSATGPLYVYLIEHGGLPRESRSYVSEQGVKLGRRSVLHVRVDVESDKIAGVEVGGRAIQVGSGTITTASEAV